MNKNIIFDADDTLWENQRFFNEFTDIFRDMIKENNIDVKNASEILMRFDEESYKRNEFGNVYYRESMIRTLNFFNIDSHENIHRINSEHDRLFEHPPVLFDDVYETVEYLYEKGYSLYILTKGYYPVQMKKVEQSGLEKYMISVIITTRKDNQIYKNIISRYNLDEKKTYMIGNSPKSDITPALNAGMNAIYIPSHSLWELEHEELDNTCERLREIKEFRQLKEIF